MAFALKSLPFTASKQLQAKGVTALSLTRGTSSARISTAQKTATVWTQLTATRGERRGQLHTWDNSRLPTIPDSGRHVSVSVRAASSTSSVADVAVGDSTNVEEKKEDDESWQIKMLYDGDCPLCMREVNMLRERNKSYKAIKFVDIAAPNYDPKENAGIDFEQAMGTIHGIERDNTVVTGIRAFTKFYEVLGLGWVYAITKVKPIDRIADAVYNFWAKYRLQVTGRPALNIVMEQRRLQKEAEACASDRCKLDD